VSQRFKDEVSTILRENSENRRYWETPRARRFVFGVSSVAQRHWNRVQANTTLL
jgi:hypothetical protein